MDTRIQWGVFVIIFLPIVFGLFLFGWFAWKGEYDHLPESSAEYSGNKFIHVPHDFFVPLR